ncbi:hypothetical protein YC2023_070784 [Brassica napus]
MTHHDIRGVIDAIICSAAITLSTNYMTHHDIRVSSLCLILFLNVTSSSHITLFFNVSIYAHACDIKTIEEYRESQEE